MIYDVLIADTIQDIIIIIMLNRLSVNGWQASGGVACDDRRYFQAIINHSDEGVEEIIQRAKYELGDRKPLME